MGILGEKVFPCLFQLLETAHIPCLKTSFLTLQSQQWRKIESLLRYAVLCRFSHVQLFVTLWTLAHQAPLFMGFSRQEYWSGLLCLPPGDLPWPRDQTHRLFKSPALAGRFFTTSTTREAPWVLLILHQSDPFLLQSHLLPPILHSQERVSVFKDSDD